MVEFYVICCSLLYLVDIFSTVFVEVRYKGNYAGVYRTLRARVPEFCAVENWVSVMRNNSIYYLLLSSG